MGHYVDPDVEEALPFDFDDPLTWIAKPKTLEAAMQWVKRTVTFHRDRVSWARPPDFPFVLRLDPMSSMLTFTCANRLTLDIDDVDKRDAAKKMRRFARRNELTLRLFETDHGMHGYCTSKTFHWRDGEVQEIMSDLEDCDKLYIAFVAHRGFSWRVSPKLFSKSGRDKRLPSRSRSSLSCL